MILNKLEFLLMINPLRAFIQEKYEMSIFCKMLTGTKISNALEIGCGNGNGARLIKKYFKPETIVAVDLDEKMVEIAKKGNNDTSIDFMIMDAAQLKFPENSFDVVFDFGIIHHIPNWRGCLRELKRVLKNNGELMLQELAIESFSGFPGILWKSLLAHPYEEMFTFKEFEEYLEETGFKIISKKISNPLGLIKHVFLNAKINIVKDA